MTFSVSSDKRGRTPLQCKIGSLCLVNAFLFGSWLLSVWERHISAACGCPGLDALVVPPALIGRTLTHYIWPADAFIHLQISSDCTWLSSWLFDLLVCIADASMLTTRVLTVSRRPVLIFIYRYFLPLPCIFILFIHSMNWKPNFYHHCTKHLRKPLYHISFQRYERHV